MSENLINSIMYAKSEVDKLCCRTSFLKADTFAELLETANVIFNLEEHEKAWLNEALFEYLDEKNITLTLI